MWTIASRMYRSTLSRPRWSTSNTHSALSAPVASMCRPRAPCVVRHPAQQPVGDPGCATGPKGDHLGATGVDGDVESRRPLDDGDPPRPSSRRAGDIAEAVASGGATRPTRVVAPTRVNRGRSSRIDRAAGPLQTTMSTRSPPSPDRAPPRPAGKPVDLVDEQDVPLLQVGEDGGEVTRPLQRGPRGDAQNDAHLSGEDRCERRLAESGRSGEQHVVDGLPSGPGRLDEDVEALLEGLLADEVAHPSGPEPGSIPASSEAVAVEDSPPASFGPAERRNAARNTSSSGSWASRPRRRR